MAILVKIINDSTAPTYEHNDDTATQDMNVDLVAVEEVDVAYYNFDNIDADMQITCQDTTKLCACSAA